MSTIYYFRNGGFQPPPDRELLEIDALGSFNMWRSIGWATSHPTAVGRFACQLPPELTERLNQMAQKVIDIGPMSIPALPDSPLERIEVGSVQALLGIHDLPPGDWGAMVKQLRELLHTLTLFPLAALALETSPDGQSARLVQSGAESLHLDLSTLSVRAELRQGTHIQGKWSIMGNSLQLVEVKAEQGWFLDLPFNHGFEVAPGQHIVAYANLGIYDGSELIEVSLKT